MLCLSLCKLETFELIRRGQAAREHAKSQGPFGPCLIRCGKRRTSDILTRHYLDASWIMTSKAKSDTKILKGQEAEDKVLEYMKLVNHNSCSGAC